MLLYIFIGIIWLGLGVLYTAMAKSMTPDWKFSFKSFFQILGGPLSFFFSGNNII